MKIFFSGLVLFICALAYIRSEQPKIRDDCLAALNTQEKVSSTSPIAITPTNSEAQTSPNSLHADTPTGIIPNTNASAPNSDAPFGIYLTTNAVINSPKAFVAPDPLPAQPNWTWTVQGKDYHNVVVTRVEADCVHTTYDGGIGSLKQSDLPPDLQKMFNYDPELARQAAQQKAEALAQAEAAEAPKVDVLKQQQQSAKAYENNTQSLVNQIHALQEKIQKEQDLINTAHAEYDNLTDTLRHLGSNHDKARELWERAQADALIFNGGPNNPYLSQLAADQATLASLQATPASQ